MISDQRHQKIINLLEDLGAITVSDLVKELRFPK